MSPPSPRENVSSILAGLIAWCGALQAASRADQQHSATSVAARLKMQAEIAAEAAREAEEQAAEVARERLRADLRDMRMVRAKWSYASTS